MFYSKNLKKHSDIQHCFFSRKNGASSGIYASLNCGIGSDDKKENVKKNLDIVSSKFEVKKNGLITMKQTHSDKVEIIKQTANKATSLLKPMIKVGAQGSHKEQLSVSDWRHLLSYWPVSNKDKQVSLSWSIQFLLIKR